MEPDATEILRLFSKVPGVGFWLAGRVTEIEDLVDDYDDVDNPSIEGRQKLKAIQPFTLGQASRISGVNPADIAILSVYIKGGAK